MTKKRQNELTKSRKQNDKLKSMDDLHAEAFLEELYDDMASFQHRVRWFESFAETAEKMVAQFAGKLSEGTQQAYDAFRWADEVMDASSKARVYRLAVMVLQEKGLEALEKVARDEALRAARYPSRSTSAAANYMASSDASAWAEVLEMVELVERW